MSKGHCYYCQGEYTKAGMLRHTTACKERLKEIKSHESGKQCGYYTLAITGRYCNNYWLIIECKEDAKLQDLDQFLRDIWLECCGHLSAFYVEDTTYDSHIDKSSNWDYDSKSMKYQLKGILSKGMKIRYEYDFGTTTTLIITVGNYRVGPWKKEKVTILARNNPIEFLCSNCGKKNARYICAGGIYDGNAYLCEDCADSYEGEEEVLLPVCNSPRCGECYYEGSTKYGD